MDNVASFPMPPHDPYDFIKPYVAENRCEIEGRIIPRLTALIGDGIVTLIVDRRFAVDVPANNARQVAWLVAQALAVGAGYSHIGAEAKGGPFASISVGLSDI